MSRVPNSRFTSLKHEKDHLGIVPSQREGDKKKGRKTGVGFPKRRM